MNQTTKEEIIKGFIKRLIDEETEEIYIGYYTAILILALEDDSFWEQENENKKTS